MSDMVERVARSIWEAECAPCGDDVQAWQRAVARAAIAAMRDPTHQQLAEGWIQLRRNIPVSEWLLGPGPALKEAYQAMIDAATG